MTAIQRLPSANGLQQLPSTTTTCSMCKATCVSNDSPNADPVQMLADIWRRAQQPMPIGLQHWPAWLLQHASLYAGSTVAAPLGASTCQSCTPGGDWSAGLRACPYYGVRAAPHGRSIAIRWTRRRSCMASPARPHAGIPHRRWARRQFRGGTSAKVNTVRPATSRSCI